MDGKKDGEYTLDSGSTLPVGDDDVARRRQLDAVADEVARCRRCDLYVGARQAVPGAGNPLAEVMLVGEAPSIHDDRRGYPFSGPSGIFLDELLEMAGLSRRDVYLTNLVRHRVPGSRELAASEIVACADYLTRQIAAVDPLVIVALGRGALARFLPGTKISSIHGQAKISQGRVIVAMYNPAAALHREELRQTVIDDFRQALPAALSEAHRLATEGKIGSPSDNSPDNPQQLSLF